MNINKILGDLTDVSAEKNPLTMSSMRQLSNVPFMRFQLNINIQLAMCKAVGIFSKPARAILGNYDPINIPLRN